MNRKPKTPGRGPSARVLGELPTRAASFLYTVGTHPGIRARLVEGGYSAADHEEGTRLLAAACAFGSVPLPCTDEAVREANAAVESWVTTHFPRLRAAVERLHPNATSPFAKVNIKSRSGSTLVALGHLLGRLDKLEQSPSGAAIVDTIARRGVDRAERARLMQLLTLAQGTSMSSFPGPSPEREDRREELTALWRWYTDWSATARALIPRRDWLIALGLAARRRKEAAEATKRDG